MLLKLITKGSFRTFTGCVRRVLICPDKYKFSLTSAQVSDAIKKSIPSGVESRVITLADGGEGSLETIATKMSGKWVSCQVADPLFRTIQAEYFQTSRKEAYIEMARASGLALLRESERNPLKTSTLGTGQLILNSLERGNSRINILIGGSATNDGGIGCAAALGFHFLDRNSQQLLPIGGNLSQIKSFEQINTKTMELIEKAQLTVYSDVLNPLTGRNGATYVYGPQKGVNEHTVDLLDRGLENLSNLFKRRYGIDMNQVPGSGGAGGLGAGCHGFLKARLLRGIDLIFEITEFERALEWADLVITGEGKFDGQTLEGKVVKGVIERCLSRNKKAVVLSAIVEQTSEYPWSETQVKVIELLTAEQKKMIDPDVTRSSLQKTVASLFQGERQ